MSDIASLGIKITTEGFEKGKPNLDQLTISSEKTEKAAVKMEATTSKAFKAVGTSSQALDVMNRNLTRAQQEIRQVATVSTSAATAISSAANATKASVAAFDQEAVAAKRAADAIRGRNAATHAGPMNTANIAAQFQDIGVTAAMGMSPMSIALQQGTQLSAALGSQGLKGTILSLGAAFASVLSPVSLLTIGVVGLGTWGIQALMGMMNSADDATASLERHSAWLDKILKGYDEARDAANEAAVAAERMPAGAVQSNLGAELTRAQGEYQAKLEATSRAQQELNSHIVEWNQLRADSLRQFPDDESRLARFDSLIQMSSDINQVKLSTSSTAAEIDAFITKATELFNVATDPAIRQNAQDMIAFGESLLTARGQIQSTSAAIAEMKAQSPINIAINVATDQVTAAIEQLKQLTPDLRTPGEVQRANAREQLNIGLGGPDAVLRQAAQGQYDQAISAMDEMDRRAAALKASRASGAASSPGNQWGNATDQMQQRIDQMKLEMDLMGKSTFEVDRQTTAFNLMNQAKAAGIPIGETVTNQINTMATEYATASSQMEAAAESQRRWQEEVDFARGTFQGFFGDLRSGMSDGVLGWDDLANAGVNALNKIADRALGMAADGIFDMLFGALTGAVTGGAGAAGGVTTTLQIRKAS